jgi:hypothetical protein
MLEIRNSFDWNILRRSIKKKSHLDMRRLPTVERG